MLSVRGWTQEVVLIVASSFRHQDQGIHSIKKYTGTEQASQVGCHCKSGHWPLVQLNLLQPADLFVVLPS